jgi:hypothetical protein
LTQAIIAFATTLFIGPSFIFGLSRVITEGGGKMTSFVALFGITQAVGSLAGTAFVQTYLYYAQQLHLLEFAGQAVKSKATVISLLSHNSDLFKAVVSDPVLRTGEGTLTFAQQSLLYARVAAYNDLFFAISVIAFSVAVIVASAMLYGKIFSFLAKRHET